MIYESAVELKQTYRDTVTGYEGVAVAVDFWENGCCRVQLETADKDGKPEAVTFDEQRLVLAEESMAAAGGPRESAARPASAERR